LAYSYEGKYNKNNTTIKELLRSDQQEKERADKEEDTLA
jgi:hypothetical protein